VGEFGVAINTWLRHRQDTDFEFFASGGSAPLQWRNGVYTSKCATQDRTSFTAQPEKGCRTLLTPRLTQLIRSRAETTFRQTTVIVALGTNMSSAPERRSEEIKWASQLLHDITLQQARCIWIGPPQMSKFSDQELEVRYRMIQAAIELESKASGASPCALIDSRKISAYADSLLNPAKKPDGIHYDLPGTVYKEGLEAARKWGESAVQEIEALLIQAYD
jgi:hypothetical protein